MCSKADVRAHVPGLYQGDPIPGSEFLAAQSSGLPVCLQSRQELNCTAARKFREVPGSIRQACGAVLKSVYWI